MRTDTTMSHISQPLPPRFCISGANLVTALGNDAPTTGAAWITRRRGLRFFEHEDTKLYTAPAIDVTGRLEGANRIRALLDALLHGFPTLSPTDSLPRPRTHCLLLLPDWLTVQDLQTLCSTVCTGLSARLPETRALDIQYGTGSSALDGYALLRMVMTPPRSQQADHYILIAADSLCEPTILKHNHANGWVGHTGARRLDTAGEAAAGVILSRIPAGAPIPHDQIALSLPAITNPSPEPRWNSTLAGDGTLLKQAWEQALADGGLGLDHIGHVIDDNDDQPWKSEDKLRALERLCEHQQSGFHAQDLHGAGALGHIGVATGPVHWALTDTLHRRCLAPISTVLSTFQHRNGACAAVTLQAGHHTPVR